MSSHHRCCCDQLPCCDGSVVIAPDGSFSVNGVDAYQMTTTFSAHAVWSVTNANNPPSTTNGAGDLSNIGPGVILPTSGLVSNNCSVTRWHASAFGSPNPFGHQSGYAADAQIGSGGAHLGFSISILFFDASTDVFPQQIHVSFSINILDPQSSILLGFVSVDSPGNLFDQMIADQPIVALDADGNGTISIALSADSVMNSPPGTFGGTMNASFTATFDIAGVKLCPAALPPPTPPCCVSGAMCGPGNATSSNLTGRYELSVQHIMRSAPSNFACGVRLRHDTGGFRGATMPFDAPPITVNGLPCSKWLPSASQTPQDLPIDFEAEGVFDPVGCAYLPQPAPHFLRHIGDAPNNVNRGVHAGANGQYGVGFEYIFQALANAGGGFPGGAVHIGRLTYTDFNGALAFGFQYSGATGGDMVRVPPTLLPFTSGHIGSGTLEIGSSSGNRTIEYNIQAFPTFNPSLTPPCSYLPTAVTVIGFIVVRLGPSFVNTAFRGELIHQIQFTMGIIFDAPFVDCAQATSQGAAATCSGCGSRGAL